MAVQGGYMDMIFGGVPGQEAAEETEAGGNDIGKMMQQMMHSESEKSQIGQQNMMMMQNPMGNTQTASFNTDEGGYPMVLPPLGPDGMNMGNVGPMDITPVNFAQGNGGYGSPQADMSFPQSPITPNQFNQDPQVNNFQGQQQQQQAQGGGGGFLNLTGTSQDPNAFLRMSQGYQSGGMLGALGMLLTRDKNNQQQQQY